eukprot:2840746-Amphidinium_carterae.1
MGLESPQSWHTSKQLPNCFGSDTFAWVLHSAGSLQPNQPLVNNGSSLNPKGISQQLDARTHTHTF